MVGLVSDLWRYPVASMGGERLRRVFVGPLGVVGDRRYAIMEAGGGTQLTALRNPGLLTYRARCVDVERGEDVVVDGPDDEWAWDDPSLPRALRGVIEDGADRRVAVVRVPAGLHAAQPVALLAESSVRAVSAWAGEDVDRRRLRPNVMVEADDGGPFPEDAWMGRRLRIGDAEVEVTAPTRRSGVMSRDPDTAERDTRAHAALARERRNHVGACCRVVRPGWIAVGDPVRLSP